MICGQVWLEVSRGKEGTVLVCSFHYLLFVPSIGTGSQQPPTSPLRTVDNGEEVRVGDEYEVSGGGGGGE
jgi:hypothetical protein